MPYDIGITLFILFVMKFLLPLSWLYGGLMSIRNWLFDYGVKSQTAFDIPTIAVGNLAVGGTGKTPHTEYLLKILSEEGWQCAMLSRGYGRKTKGFYEGKGASAQDIGDEPWQVQQKFPKVRVCVCEKRVAGIKRILEKGTHPQVIVLDDAFQHRYVKPGISILLTDYARPYFSDAVMPAGRLREFPGGAKRADIIIVTKCPEDITLKQQEEIQGKLCPLPFQKVFFTRFAYGTLYPYLKEGAITTIDTSEKKVLLMCGIARPESLIAHLNPKCKELKTHTFPDHHNFTSVEIAELGKEAQACDCVITTEKDAARLSGYNLPAALSQRLWVQPIEVIFINKESNKFNKTITDYVTENSRNR